MRRMECRLAGVGGAKDNAARTYRNMFAGVVTAIFAALALQVGAECVVGKVTRVSDGDTLWVTDAANVKHKIRLARIDAPEKDQPWGGESAAVLKGWVYGRDVRVEFAKRDQYGRILGIVFNGTNDVNLAMVRSGNAWHYSHFDKTPAYGAAEREAKDARRGLWSQPDPINPYDWRKAKRKM